MQIKNILNKTTKYFKQSEIVKKLRRIIKKNFNNIKAFVLSSRKKSIVATVLVAVVILIPCVPLGGITLAYEVESNGEQLGYVQSEDIYDTAENIANSQIEGDIKEIVAEPVYSVAVVPTSKLSNANEISEKIIDTNEENLVNGYGIFVDGKCIASTKSTLPLKSAINWIKLYYNTITNSTDAAFQEDVKIDETIIVKDYVDSDLEIKAILKQNVHVVTTISKSKKAYYEYGTVETIDPTISEDVVKIIAEGTDGEKEYITTKNYVNGVYTDTSKSEVVTKEAIPESIVIGTLPAGDVYNVSYSDGAKYSWPIAYGSGVYVSSPFGMRSGKLHKGIDICAPYGTNIYSAMKGTVIRSEYYFTYGLCIDVKHPDGVVTRYAHCSALLANVGDEVQTGQLIAKVGLTGNTSGSHCHFEVWANASTPVNPYNYIGNIDGSKHIQTVTAASNTTKNNTKATVSSTTTSKATSATATKATIKATTTKAASTVAPTQSTTPLYSTTNTSAE